MENLFEIILEKLNNIEKAIEKLNTSSNNDDDFMNIEQVASFVGLSKATVYGLILQRKIPHFKVGKRLYFKKSEIVNWIISSKVKTEQEVNQLADEYIFKTPLY
ncbi:transcriptional regulator, AlpA family [Flavobacterium omnivorum]|uniref:Transcriptional regulator, AlpA family n=1 Tax=Flavobacterium omnivorum TaxID=178355 RepID=A0A1G8BH71_9FLAO|nr:helix-turn-helix domain-containing protein [Flavobacterium omnivorum]SDH32567.1 transcriptional regulator, AlpA family [Flavobacterium omnivorum]